MNVVPMSRPVTPGLLRKWLELKQEFVGVVKEALEQGAQVDRAVTALQQLKARPDGPYGRSSGPSKKTWTGPCSFRDETLALTVSIEEKM